MFKVDPKLHACQITNFIFFEDYVDSLKRVMVTTTRSKIRRLMITNMDAPNRLMIGVGFLVLTGFLFVAWDNDSEEKIVQKDLNNDYSANPTGSSVLLDKLLVKSENSYSVWPSFLDSKELRNLASFDQRFFPA